MVHWCPLDCFKSHVGEHRTVRGLWKRQGIPCFFKIPTVQQSPEEETPFVYVTLATHVSLATAGYTPCLFGYVTIGLARHNRTHFSQSERLLVKPQRPCTDLCAEPVGVWNRLGVHCQCWNVSYRYEGSLKIILSPFCGVSCTDHNGASSQQVQTHRMTMSFLIIPSDLILISMAYCKTAVTPVR